jgi:hypothetical protein
MAEQYLHSDPQASVTKMRLIVEQMTTGQRCRGRRYRVQEQRDRVIVTVSRRIPKR